MGIKTDGTRCTRQGANFTAPNAPHLHHCSIHWPVYFRHVEARAPLTDVLAEQHHRNGTCIRWMPTRQNWCGDQCVPGHIMCAMHDMRAHGREVRRNEARQAEVREEEGVNQLYEFFEAQRVTWREAVDRMTDPDGPGVPARMKYRVARRIFAHPFVIEVGFDREWQFQEYWRWAIGGRVGPAPDLTRPPPVAFVAPPVAARNNLAGIARDAQNVHTRVVAEQTNAGLEKLLATLGTETKTLRAPEWFAAKWLVRGYGHWSTVTRVVNDMKIWYDTPSCKTANDWLYRKALDGLYMTIQANKDNNLRSELYKRVFEECNESVGMCCEGHISRLCNVLVGFDENFQPPVPFADILQSKMAAIAALEVDTNEKIRQANEFFNEHAFPEGQRGAWLEAF